MELDPRQILPVMLNSRFLLLVYISQLVPVFSDVNDKELLCSGASKLVPDSVPAFYAVTGPGLHSEGSTCKAEKFSWTVWAEMIRKIKK